MIASNISKFLFFILFLYAPAAKSDAVAAAHPPSFSIVPPIEKPLIVVR